MAISLACLPFPVWAAGSGLNVVLVINQTSTNSVQLGNYYAERRQLPPQNVLRIQWAGGNAIWTRAQFETNLAAPLRNTVASRGLTNQIDFVVLSMDIPYRVTDTNGLNSTTAALFYGFKPDTTPPTPNSCSLPGASFSAYAGSEDIFRKIAPGTNATNFLVTMITASNLAQAKLIIDRGLVSDATFPTQKVYLGKSTDTGRNVRYQLFDNAVFNTRLRGNYSMQRTNIYGISGLGDLLGAQTGGYNYGVAGVTFAPGAMADNLTSYGGLLFEPSGDQLNILSLLAGGATGSYGTVVEPCAYLQKFPDPQNYFYQARGFSLAECYYQSLTNPYQGLIVGEPLAAPFAQPASGAWNNLATDALLSGTTNLALQFIASDAQHPLEQVDLFLDGLFLQTLTNIPPAQSNVLYVTLPGRTNMSYAVPPGNTLKSVAAGLTAILNQPSNQNTTKVEAIVHGDRIELRSSDTNRTGDQTFVAVSNSIGGGSVLSTFLTASRSNFLDSIAWEIRSFSVTNVPLVGDYLQLIVTKTNASQVIVAATNTPPGTNLAALAERLFGLVNTNTSLLSPDGLVAEDAILYERYPELFGTNLHLVEFNLRARTEGWHAAQIQVNLIGSPTFTITPNGPNDLDENLSDLQPRNHLYVTCGTTNLPLTFAFNTTNHADGYHELTAVVYEGSHVRTQKRIAQNVRIQNTLLAATFTSFPGGSNIAVEATLQFVVTANTNTIAKIELFSTGGLLATVTNQFTASFAVTGTNLDLGLHPFYAVVTANNGKRYRTETKLIRLVGVESPFPIQLTGPPPYLLTWPAIAGRSYDVLSADVVTNAFPLRETVIPTNFGVYQWIETNPNSPQRFYRVRVSP